MNEQRVTTKHVAVGDTMVFPTHFDFSDGTGVGRRVERSVAKVVEIRNDSQAKTIIGDNGAEWYGGAASKVTKVVEPYEPADTTDRLRFDHGDGPLPIEDAS